MVSEKFISRTILQENLVMLRFMLEKTSIIRVQMQKSEIFMFVSYPRLPRQVKQDFKFHLTDTTIYDKDDDNQTVILKDYIERLY